MKSYRKKPVLIEAIEWTGLNLHELDRSINAVLLPNGCLDIETLEGTMRARPGDFIIKGIKGEFYPCKADIFAATYEEA